MSSRANPTETEGAFEPLAEQFFSSPPPAEVEVERDAWDQQPMSAGNRRAMQVTFALLGCGAAAVLGFAVLSEWVLVSPAELGGVASQASLSNWTAPTEAHAVRGEAPAAAAQFASAEPLAVRREDAPVLPPAAGAPDVAGAVEAAVPATEISASTNRPVELVSAVAQPAEARARSLRGERRSAGRGDRSADESLTKRAYSALASGRASEAEQLARRALASDGTRAATYIVLAGARDALGNREGARAAFRDCIQRAQDAQVSTCRTLAR